jgi:formimidoylglutamate deiminase
LNRQQVIEADWTWTGEHFESGVQVMVDEHGRIGKVGRLEARPSKRLRDRALLPGFVDAHSHAFQRGLRGHGEIFPEGAGSFWSWREAMYALVESLDANAFYRLTLQAFRELRSAGVTSIGEFHYFHHGPEGDDYAFDELILKAASRVGVRLVLLESYYRTGAPNQPLQGGQQRFRTRSPEEFWAQVDRLQALQLPPTQTIGVAPHSLRAAAPAEVAEIAQEAQRRGMVVHMHVEEQRKEVEECLAAWGRRPMAILLESVRELRGVVAVHCTHTTPEDLLRFADRGGRVCVCPLTEGNLGDGIGDFSGLAPAAAPHRDNPPFALGSDSNVRLSFLEEMRWFEFAQRLRSESRGVLRDVSGRVGQVLFETATRGGAAALGLPTGAMAAGLWADFVAVDLNAPALTGCDPQNLIDTLVFGGSESAIASTCVGGQWMDHRESGTLV